MPRNPNKEYESSVYNNLSAYDTYMRPSVKALIREERASEGTSWSKPGKPQPQSSRPPRDTAERSFRIDAMVEALSRKQQEGARSIFKTDHNRRFREGKRTAGCFSPQFEQHDAFYVTSHHKARGADDPGYVLPKHERIADRPTLKQSVVVPQKVREGSPAGSGYSFHTSSRFGRPIGYDSPAVRDHSHMSAALYRG